MTMQEITKLLDRTMTNLDTILAERERMIAEREDLVATVEMLRRKLKLAELDVAIGQCCDDCHGQVLAERFRH